MSTRCAIGLLRPNGTVLAIYCHHDGYPDGVGRCLLKAYTAEDRIRDLLELGAISSIGDNLSKEEGDDPCDPYCAGENPEISQITVFPNKDWYQKKAPDYMDAEYLYLFENGRWFIYPVFHNKPMWYDLAEKYRSKSMRSSDEAVAKPNRQATAIFFKQNWKSFDNLRFQSNAKLETI